jgi:hypothetical protein
MFVMALGGALIATAILFGLPRRPDSLSDNEEDSIAD